MSELSMFQKMPPLLKGILFLTLSAFLFSLMGVAIRMLSHTVDNATIVFFRNFIGLLMLVPVYAVKGFGQMKTQHLDRHVWRSVVGLSAMYCFFYAIAHLPLSNAMVFTYSAPVFIPLMAYLFLKEKMTAIMWISALLGMVGVLLVAKPEGSFLNILSIVGILSSILASIAFVTVRKLTETEPATRIVFYFCLISSVISAIPMFWHIRVYTVQEWALLLLVGTVATLSQISLSQAYSYAPAGQIGPVNYLTIVFAGIWSALLWREYPTLLSVSGMVIIFGALILLMSNQFKKISVSKSA